MGDIQKLKAWNEAVELASEVYIITSTGTISKDFGLRDQMRRAAVSVASNIAEGEESGSDGLFIRYLNIARGSLAELKTQLLIATQIDYVKKNEVESVIDQINKISSMLYNLIQHRSSQLPATRNPNPARKP
jgi:four helix bundle protein